MGTLTVLALLPAQHLQLSVLDWWDKAQHALAFVVLTGWALLLWSGAALRVVVGMMAYGAGIELAQWAVGWRFAEWADLAADAVGVLVAWGLLSSRGWILRSSRRMTERESEDDRLTWGEADQENSSPPGLDRQF